MPSASSPPELDLTVLLPCYNEGPAIAQVIAEVQAALAAWQGTWEILVIDDASTDDTSTRAAAAFPPSPFSEEGPGVRACRVIRRMENGGSGAARKTGILAARGSLIAMLDGDGSYDPACLPQLLAFFPDYDQVNGARTSEQGTLRPLRYLAKFVLRKVAEWVSGKRIPDLNTGLKIFKRDIMLDCLWVLPTGFSCVTSMTLAFLTNGHPVKYVPVNYRPRVGHSKFRPIRDTAQYAFTILRMMTYFRPLRVFFPLAILLGVLALVRGSYNLLVSPLGLTDADIIMTLTALLVFLAGLLADLLVAQRRH